MTSDANSPLKAYIHQHAWLQYASLALTAAATLYTEHDGSVDAPVRDSATRLYETNVQTTIDYFTKRVNYTQLGETGLISWPCLNLPSASLDFFP